jgi:hypothetical protein
MGLSMPKSRFKGVLVFFKNLIGPGG